MAPARCRETELLTVWRRLHVEVDSMAEPTGTSVTGNITNVVDNGNGTVTVTTDQDLDDSLDRFVPGVLQNDGKEFPVTASGAGANFTVTVEKVNGVSPVTGAFTLLDDDVVPQDVPDPLTSLLAEKFQPAYVTVVLDGGGDPNNNDPDAPFALNLAGDWPAALEVQAQLSRQSSSSTLFWTTHCLGCFQGVKAEDNDPGTQEHRIEGCPLGLSSRGSGFVFSEHHREYGLEEDTYRAHTLVHEVGHAFRLEDEYEWTPPPYPADPNYNGIMYWVWKGVFTDGNIASIRSIDYPSKPKAES